ncbi:MAG: ATP-binding cassette domain-containing protein [Brevinema sp.]
MVVQVTNLSKKILDGAFQRNLLENINLNIKKNEIVALVGTSGAGKSALLRILSCLEVAYEGEYLFNGTTQIINLPESGLANIRRQYMGFIGFEPEFIDQMSVKECLEMPLIALGVSYKERKNRMIDILELVGLLSKLNSSIHSLQHYERMYISAARAFIKKPLLVVADDPCKQLHSSEALALLELMTKLSQEYNSALVYSTYDPNHLKKADKIVYMKDGKIIKIA